MPHAALYLFSPVLNYLLNNSAWGKGIISGYKKAEFFYTLLAVMLLSNVWDVWNLLFSKGSTFKVAVGECHRCTDLKKVSVTLLDESPKAFPMSLFLFPSISTSGIKSLNGERIPPLLGLAGGGCPHLQPAALCPQEVPAPPHSPQWNTWSIFDHITNTCIPHKLSQKALCSR